MGFSEMVQQLPQLIGSAVEANPFLGYVAIFATRFLENLFPPIPSEMIMPLGGALPWYGLGRLINEERLEQWLERHGRWIGISANDLKRSRIWFNRYGTALVFWGRLVPGVRTLISVPAGMELMPFTPFLLWTTGGSLIWVLILTLSGLALGSGYDNVELWLEPVAKAVKVILVIAALAFGSWLGLRAWRRR